MAQLVTRVDEETVQAVDELIEVRSVGSRSGAVRRGLALLIEQERRRRIETAIVAGYTTLPQTEEEVGWADEATVRLISDEPW